jgi:hypothetical protein
MACSYDSKKSHQCNLDSDSEDEVRDEFPFLCEDNERLSQLPDNRDDMLREAKKMRKEFRTSLKDAIGDRLEGIEFHSIANVFVRGKAQ